MIKLIDENKDLLAAKLPAEIQDLHAEIERVRNVARALGGPETQIVAGLLDGLLATFWEKMEGALTTWWEGVRLDANRKRPRTRQDLADVGAALSRAPERLEEPPPLPRERRRKRSFGSGVWHGYLNAENRRPREDAVLSALRAERKADEVAGSDRGGFRRLLQILGLRGLPANGKTSRLVTDLCNEGRLERKPVTRPGAGRLGWEYRVLDDLWFGRRCNDEDTLARRNEIVHGALSMWLSCGELRRRLGVNSGKVDAAIRRLHDGGRLVRRYRPDAAGKPSYQYIQKEVVI